MAEPDPPASGGPGTPRAGRDAGTVFAGRPARPRIPVPRRRRRRVPRPRVPLGRPIARRRAVWGGWVAADDRAVVVRRPDRPDLRVPHRAVRQIWLEGRNLALVADGGIALYLPLLSLRGSGDRRFVRAVRHACARTGGDPVLRRPPLRRLVRWLRGG